MARGEQRKGASDPRVTDESLVGVRKSSHYILRIRHCVGVTPVSLLNATPNELWLA